MNLHIYLKLILIHSLLNIDQNSFALNDALQMMSLIEILGIEIDFSHELVPTDNVL
jgi:hypothetical protein